MATSQFTINARRIRDLSELTDFNDTVAQSAYILVDNYGANNSQYRTQKMSIGVLSSIFENIIQAQLTADANESSIKNIIISDVINKYQQTIGTVAQSVASDLLSSHNNELAQNVLSTTYILGGESTSKSLQERLAASLNDQFAANTGFQESIASNIANTDNFGTKLQEKVDTKLNETLYKQDICNMLITTHQDDIVTNVAVALQPYADSQISNAVETFMFSQGIVALSNLTASTMKSICLDKYRLITVDTSMYSAESKVPPALRQNIFNTLSIELPVQSVDDACKQFRVMLPVAILQPYCYPLSTATEIVSDININDAMTGDNNQTKIPVVFKAKTPTDGNSSEIPIKFILLDRGITQATTITSSAATPIADTFTFSKDYFTYCQAASGIRLINIEVIFKQHAFVTIDDVNTALYTVESKYLVAEYSNYRYLTDAEVYAAQSDSEPNSEPDSEPNSEPVSEP